MSTSSDIPDPKSRIYRQRNNLGGNPVFSCVFVASCHLVIFLPRRYLVIDSFALAQPRCDYSISPFYVVNNDHHQSSCNHQSLVVSASLRKLVKNRVIVNTSMAKFLADQNIQELSSFAPDVGIDEKFSNNNARINVRYSMTSLL